MEVILNKDVEKIGRAGTVVCVKEGFARNFLFPHNLAKPATASSLKKLEQDQLIQSAQSAKIKEEFELIKQRLSTLVLTIPALTQGEEKLYGSIGVQEISEALKAEGFSINKSMLDLAEPIKSLGIYQIPVKLYPEVVATVKLSVVKKVV
ncbi:MAG: 50S ribosomal protein L9 [Candidatus Omnitrophica bacterium]|nr:50S ribosomal protein L9 [Candidatus Omnitrophota bacterium]MBU4303082.1 50S ribosomal protein L9 [Candidatus Omnitrophota bacterium]MBU4418319.1 50S ribosomal protein L9 [Candidatus Omnitrophota bacterium]MBU4468235.1 50S ribosomal protein L9 [Candidatus Omnitrophota bacterium]MCG2707247.1 50S ribosomal protein L9 [Candidatus Omnitrophota bacterium]